MEDKNRLKYYQKFYFELNNNSNNYNNNYNNNDINKEEEKEVINEIIVSLHDYWSEVRKISFKGLKLISFKLSYEIIQVLFEIFLNKDDNLTWQSIHGNLLGIRALIERINELSNLSSLSISTSNYISQIKELCFERISHLNLSIRDVARECLLDLIQIETQTSQLKIISEDIKNHLLLQIKESVMNDINNNKEDYSNYLHGLLSLLSDIILLSNEENELFIKSYIEILNLCLSHPSSTVRIQSTITVKSLYWKSCPLYELDDLFIPIPQIEWKLTCLDLVLQSSINVIENSNQITTNWKSLEGYLLIIEDIFLRLSLSQVFILTNLQDKENKEDKEKKQLFSLFLKIVFPFLNQLQSLISLPIFEIQRLIAQILPSFARVCILYSFSESSPNTFLNKDIFNNFIPNSWSIELLFVFYVEVIKSISILIEVDSNFNNTFNNTLDHENNDNSGNDNNDNNQKDNNINQKELNLLLTNTYYKWSCNLHRRLIEADRQNSFIKLLSSLSSSSLSSSSNLSIILLEILPYWKQSLVILVQKYQNLPNDEILLIDYYEFHYYSLAFLCYKTENFLSLSFNELFNNFVSKLSIFQQLYHYNKVSSSSLSSSSTNLLNFYELLSNDNGIILTESPSLSYKLVDSLVSNKNTIKTFNYEMFHNILWESLILVLPNILTSQYFKQIYQESINSIKIISNIFKLLSITIISVPIESLKVLCDILLLTSQTLLSLEFNQNQLIEMKEIILFCELIKEFIFPSITNEIQAISNGNRSNLIKFGTVVIAFILNMEKLLYFETKKEWLKLAYSIYQQLTLSFEINSKKQNNKDNEENDNIEVDKKNDNVEDDEFSDWDDEDEEIVNENSDTLNINSYLKEFDIICKNNQ